MGLRLRWLGTEALSWLDLRVIIRGSSRETAIGRSTGGESAQWGASEHLLALILDALQGANWQRAGNKHAPRPTPVSRPGVDAAGGQRLGSEPIPISAFDDWWQQAA